MEPLILKVSPFYTGRGWYDPKSGLNFRKEYGNITVPEGKDLMTIKRDIKNNALIIISGSIEAYEKARDTKKVEVKAEVVVEAPKVETVETVETEIKVENEQEAKAEIIEEKEKTVAEAPRAPKKTGGAKKTAAKKE